MGTTRPTPPGVTEIFAEYVRQRKHGKRQDEVVNFLKPMLAKLRGDARQQLVALLRSWEAREGAKYVPKQPAQTPVFVGTEGLDLASGTREDLSWLEDVVQEKNGRIPSQRSASATQVPSESNPTSDHVSQQGHDAPALNIHATVHPSVTSAERTVQFAQPRAVACPECGRANMREDAYCFACGALLDRSLVATRSLEPADIDLKDVGATYFGRSSSLLLYVYAHERPIVVRFQGRQEVLLGRASAQSDFTPDVDLSPFDAASMGVSRQHARLHLRDNTITITDLGSVNHTYVNGQRLHPHEVRVLRDGDLIQLGRLQMRVKYHHKVGQLRA